MRWERGTLYRRLAGGVAFVLASLATAPGAALAAPIPPGFDLFETDPGPTHFNFQSPDTQIPAGFFGPGSDPFQGVVQFGGDPLNTFMGHNVGDADTVVKRPNSANPAPDATVPIELVQLSLVSVAPITVTYNHGQSPERWQITAARSPTQRSLGQITIHQPLPSSAGGTFDSQLQVIPKLTFTRISDGMTKTLDGAVLPQQAQQKLIFGQTGGVWRAGCILPALAVSGLNDGFCPGLTPTGRKQLTAESAQLAQHGVYPAQPALEHFKCYSVEPQPFDARQARLTDQFGTRTANVTKRAELCNPAQKNSEPFRNKAAHLQCYATSGPDENANVIVKNQLGSQSLTVHRPRRLCLPTQKRLLSQSFQQITVPIDHLQCYGVQARGSLLTPNPIPKVDLRDEFGTERNVRIGQPYQLCAPVQKRFQGNTTPIRNPVAHLVCYAISRPTEQRRVEIRNQFEKQRLRTRAPVGLCVPSSKYRKP